MSHAFAQKAIPEEDRQTYARRASFRGPLLAVVVIALSAFLGMVLADMVFPALENVPRVVVVLWHAVVIVPALYFFSFRPLVLRNEERRRAEEHIRHLNSILSAVRDVNQLITREKDRDRLLQQACNILVRTGRYDSAWILLLGEDGQPVTTFEAGVDEGFPVLTGELARGVLPRCARRCLAEGKVHLVANVNEQCTGCPLAGPLDGRGAASAPLKHQERFYGVLTVSFPTAQATEEQEQALLAEAASDIAFALHDLELAAKHDRTEQALRESEERFRSITACAQDAIIMMDEHGCVAYWNEAAERIFGYSSGEASGEELHTLIVPRRYHDQYLKGRARFAETGKGPALGTTLELTAVRKDGTEFPVSLSVSAVRLGGRWQAIGIVRDVTERKRAEEQLRRSEEQFRSVVDNIAVGVSVISPQMKILAANKMVREWFPGVKGDGGEICYRVFNGPPREGVCRHCPTRQTLQDGRVHEAITEMSSGGDIRNYRVVSSPLTDEQGKVVAAIELVDDITEALKAQESLRASEQRFRVLTERSLAGVMILQHGRVRYANPTTLRSLGYTLKELSARDIMDFVHPDDVTQAQSLLARVMGGETLEGVELRVLRKDGETSWRRMNASLIEYEGRPSVLVNDSDITQEKQLEQQLIQTEKLTAIGELTSGVAHELNNPLAAVLGYAELAQDLATDGELAGYLEHIVAQALRASGIVGNLLTFARQQEPQRQPVSMNAVVHQTLELRAYDLHTSNITVELDLEDTIPPVLGDPHQLAQVILNLINNAEQAIHSRGEKGTITMRTRALVTNGSPRVRLEVLDDGPGIRQTHLQRLFDPFFTTKPPGQGTGLGLSISYGIISSHEGLITAENRPQGGARFVIELPATGNAERVSSSEDSVVPTVAPARILVVEDEEAVAEMLARLLTIDGHQVTVAGDGCEALARVREQEFDLLVVDFKMPRMSGLEFYRQVTGEFPELTDHIVFSTGDVLSPDTRNFLQDVGATALHKPFSIDEARRLLYQKLSEVRL